MNERRNANQEFCSCGVVKWNHFKEAEAVLFVLGGPLGGLSLWLINILKLESTGHRKIFFYNMTIFIFSLGLRVNFSMPAI
jgi:hypothetical protein